MSISTILKLILAVLAGLVFYLVWAPFCFAAMVWSAYRLTPIPFEMSSWGELFGVPAVLLGFWATGRLD